MIIDVLTTLFDFKIDRKHLNEYKSAMDKVTKITKHLGDTTRGVFKSIQRGSSPLPRVYKQINSNIKSSITSLRRMRLQQAAVNRVASDDRASLTLAKQRVNAKLLTGAKDSVVKKLRQELNLAKDIARQSTKEETKLRNKIKLTERTINAALKEKAVVMSAHRAKQKASSETLNAQRKVNLEQAKFKRNLIATKNLAIMTGVSVKRAFRGMAHRISRTASVLIRFRNLMGVTIAGALGLKAVGSVVGVGRDFEKRRMMLRRFAFKPEDEAGTPEARAKKAKVDETFIKDLAIATPLTISEVTDAFVDMKQRGMDPANGTLKALIDTNAAYGGTAEDLRLELLQIGQAWGKNKLQGQDLRILLEKRLPLLDAMTKVLGTNTEGVYAAVKAGKVQRKELEEGIRLMGKWSEGAAKEMALTLDGLINKFQDFKEIFFLDIADAGFFTAVKDVIVEINAELTRMKESGELKELAGQVSTKLVGALRNLWGWTKRTAKAFLDGTHPIQKFFDFFGGFYATLKKIMALSVILWLQPLIPLFFGLASAIALASKGLLVFGALMLTNPWVAGLTAVAGAVAVIALNWDKVIVRLKQVVDLFDKIFTFLQFKAVGESLGKFAGMVQHGTSAADPLSKDAMVLNMLGLSKGIDHKNKTEVLRRKQSMQQVVNNQVQLTIDAKDRTDEQVKQQLGPLLIDMLTGGSHDETTVTEQ